MVWRSSCSRSGVPMHRNLLRSEYRRVLSRKVSFFQCPLSSAAARRAKSKRFFCSALVGALAAAARNSSLVLPREGFHAVIDLFILSIAVHSLSQFESASLTHSVSESIRLLSGITGPSQAQFLRDIHATCATAACCREHSSWKHLTIRGPSSQVSGETGAS